MNDSVCLPLKSVSRSEKSRLDHNGNQQRSIASVHKVLAVSLNTCMQPGTPLINGFVNYAVWNKCVMATRNLRHSETLQSKVSSQEAK